MDPNTSKYLANIKRMECLCTFIRTIICAPLYRNYTIKPAFYFNHLTILPDKNDNSKKTLGIAQLKKSKMKWVNKGGQLDFTVKTGKN